MLFSQTDVVEFLDANFECAWESVRDVPRVHVDFGNGVELERTVLGNIATWFCFADGIAYDVLPGLVDAEEFLRRARRAAAAKPRLENGGLSRHAAVLAYHSISKRPAIARQLRADLSKSRVEAPLKREIGADPVKSNIEDPIKHDFDRPMSVTKSVVELPIKRHVRAHRDAGNDAESTLAQDTRLNRMHRYPRASAIMAAQPRPVTPAELKWRVFREVLHVPLDDPFLGLAPHALGGEGGRTLPGGH